MHNQLRIWFRFIANLPPTEGVTGSPSSYGCSESPALMCGVDRYCGHPTSFRSVCSLQGVLLTLFWHLMSTVAGPAGGAAQVLDPAGLVALAVSFKEYMPFAKG